MTITFSLMPGADPGSIAAAVMKASGMPPTDVHIDTDQRVVVVSVPVDGVDDHASAKVVRRIWAAAQSQNWSIQIEADAPITIVPKPADPLPVESKNWWDSLKVGDTVKLLPGTWPIYYDPADDPKKLWNNAHDEREMTIWGKPQGEWIQVSKYPPFNLWVKAKYTKKL